MGEFELIDAHFKKLGRSNGHAVDLGIGDDCALVSVPPSQQLALSSDTLIEDVHFIKGSPPEDIGYRALAVNLSDLAAMGAKPAWFTLCLSLPNVDEQWVAGFCRGMHELCREFDVALIGGDTTSGSQLTITIQVFGLVDRGLALTRQGAREGDHIYVSGRVGEAGLGLMLSKETQPGDAMDSDLQTAVTRFQRPEPRVNLGLRLSGMASSCIDVSDGLLADLNHILESSSVGAELNLEAIPVASSLYNENTVRHLPKSLADASHDQRRLWALGAGDDYELCFTAAPDRAEAIHSIASALALPITRIGQVIAGQGMTESHGQRRPIDPRGYQHF